MGLSSGALIAPPTTASPPPHTIRGVSEPAVVLLWGDDSFLLREAALASFGGVHPPEADARSWQGGEIADLATPSLFGEPRALLVTNARHLPDGAIRELDAFLEAPPPESRVILTAEVTTRRVPAALAKVVKGRGDIREVALARKDLAKWATERARARGVPLAPDGAAALVDVLGESPAAIDSAVEQLASAFAGQRVGADQVRSQFQGLGEQRIWDLCDRIFARDTPGSIRTLRSLMESREDALFILGGLASRLRDLLMVKSFPDRMPARELAEAVGLRHEWQVRRYRDQARRFEMSELRRIHDLITAADRDIKSGGAGDVVLPVVVATAAAGGN